ncbi:MAG TPA: M48 family metallopeptidase [Gemmatimonadales bacterium]|nr:M48 family metallopeptidase [Gemmatimonadales bacterium]
MVTSRSIAVRAALAVALMAGFYLLALGIAALLLAIPVLEVRFIGHISGKLTLVAVMGAGTILWSILPRRDRFEDPGPRLEPAQHPRLFAALREVASRTGQAMPVEVFLVPQLNAWVAQRGGIMGFGSRRVMGLGLPLLEALSVRQLEAVLAHEFGHYHGGDTRLGPWIYVTRAAIGRSIHQLERQGSALAKPFEWYGHAFLRITHAVSRRQEFTADELAARTVGARAQREALRTIYGAGDAFDRYWREELVPALQHGLRPPLASGYRLYLSAAPVAPAIEASLQQAMAQTASDPYDTHPSLAERLAALEGMPDGEPGGDDPRAITLLEGVPELEQRLIGSLAAPDATFEAVGWDELGERLWRPFWRERSGQHAEGLRGLTPSELPAQAKDLTPLVVRLGLAPSAEAAAEQAPAAGWVIAAALCTALADRGWTLGTMPGDDVTLRYGGDTIRPFTLMRELAEGTVAQGDWLLLCDRTGIAGLDLGAAVAPPGGPAQPAAPRAWTFVAMEYYKLVLNRTYRVIVSETAISGARVRGLMSSPPSAPGEAWQDPDFYPNPKLEARYRELEPGSPEFLAADRANFRYEREEIASVEFIAKPKWGMGYVPCSGRILLRLRDGTRRELLLLGRQPGPAIRDELAPAGREAATAAAA